MTTSTEDKARQAERLVPTDAVLPLGVYRRLFDRLHDAGVRYCHWGNSERLAASTAGRSPLDVLCDRNAISSLSRILSVCNFKRVVVRHDLSHPGIEEYLGFDSPTATLTHLRVRYQMRLPKRVRKGDRLSWDELYLTTRVFDECHGLYVAEPHLEFIVLLMRHSLMLGLRDVAAVVTGNSDQFRCLVEGLEPERVVGLAMHLVGERAARLFPPILAAGGSTTSQLLALRRRANANYREYRWWCRRGAADGGGWKRGLRTAWPKLEDWYRPMPTGSARTLPNQGITVAVLGADGAGKSTLVGELARWLSDHLVVMKAYGGSGKGSAGLARRAMQWLGAWRRRLRGPAPVAANRPGAAAVQPLRNARAVWVLALAGERRRRALEGHSARARGAIVLSDRLAQSQFPGKNDGLRLTPWLDSDSRWRRWAARREQAAFRMCERVPPNLVIKLHVPPEVALARKPESPREQVLQGIELLENLRWPARTTVLDLDATQPLDHVIRQAKRAVWEAI